MLALSRVNFRATNFTVGGIEISRYRSHTSRRGYIPARGTPRRHASFTAPRVRMQIGAANRARNAKGRLHARARTNSRPIVSSRTDPAVVFNDLSFRHSRWQYLRQCSSAASVQNAITNGAACSSRGDFIAHKCVNSRVFNWLNKNDREKAIGVVSNATVENTRGRWFRSNKDSNRDAPFIVLHALVLSRSRHTPVITHCQVDLSTFFTSVPLSVVISSRGITLWLRNCPCVISRSTFISNYFRKFRSWMIELW